MRVLIPAVLVLAASAAHADPTAAEILKKYDEIMGPVNFESTTGMVAHREDDTERSYKMKVLKSGDDKFRIWFQEPAAVRGQEMLRQGDNMWLYMPNLKRSVRMANRDNFQGGDFNNADVLRVNYTADYEPTLIPDTTIADTWLVELKGKSTNAAYDKIKLWFRKADLQPVRGEYYTASGMMLRSAEFSDYKDFNGLVRPGKIIMRNELAKKRYSVMQWDSLNTKVAPANGRFVQDDLGK